MSGQPSLFDHAYARRSDPETSHAAAALTDANKLEALVCATLASYGPLTAHEIADKTGVPLVSISPRMKPLASQGRIVRTNIRRLTRPNGKATATVWEIAK